MSEVNPFFFTYLYACSASPPIQPKFGIRSQSISCWTDNFSISSLKKVLNLIACNVSMADVVV